LAEAADRYDVGIAPQLPDHQSPGRLEHTAELCEGDVLVGDLTEDGYQVGGSKLASS
jgi:hypothetical protein